MYSIILAAAAVTFILRILPATVPKLRKLLENPHVSRFLDYAICLITGEMIYNIAIASASKSPGHPISLNVLTLIFATLLMWRITNINLTLLVSMIFFSTIWAIFI